MITIRMYFQWSFISCSKIDWWERARWMCYWIWVNFRTKWSFIWARNLQPIRTISRTLRKTNHRMWSVVKVTMISSLYSCPNCMILVKVWMLRKICFTIWYRMTMAVFMMILMNTMKKSCHRSSHKSILIIWISVATCSYW